MSGKWLESGKHELTKIQIIANNSVSAHCLEMSDLTAPFDLERRPSGVDLAKRCLVLVVKALLEACLE